MQSLPRLKAEDAAVAVAIFVSTALSVVVKALLMRWLLERFSGEETGEGGEEA